MIKIAAKYHVLVILDPAETIDHLTVLNQNGAAKCRNYGRYLGGRYKYFPNLLWLSGNDYVDWASDPVVMAVALGIKDSDKVHLQTVELYNHPIGSHDDPNWEPIIDLCWSYPTTGWNYDPPTYRQVLKDYNNPHLMPVVMGEGAYDHCGGWNEDFLRRQSYWSNLSGATGQLYGNNDTYPFNSCWKTTLNAPSNVMYSYLKELFETRAWYNLVPDSNHQVVTAGFGNFNSATLDVSDYVTTARTADSTLAISYLPTPRALTVSMAGFRAQVKAQWFDPSNGVYTTISGSPFANTGTRNFTPPNTNSAGDADFVLVLDAASGVKISAPLPVQGKTIDLAATPNPFHAATTIKVGAMAGKKEVTVKIFSPSGSLVKEFKARSLSEVKWDASGLGAGIYLLRCGTLQMKLALLK
jgi:hypothetical protein